MSPPGKFNLKKEKKRKRGERKKEENNKLKKEKKDEEELWRLVGVLLFTSLNSISRGLRWFGSLSPGYSAGLFLVLHFIHTDFLSHLRVCLCVCDRGL